MANIPKSTQLRREALRNRFRPASLKLLFIGEAPPASGRFFYQADSGLYRAMREAFQLVDPTISEADFLTQFQAFGCYLIDLCPDPVDQLAANLRRASCVANEGALADKIGRLYPRAVATVVRSIEASVERSLRLANWHGPIVHLPYPGRWSHHKAEFIRTLKPLLETFQQTAIARP